MHRIITLTFFSLSILFAAVPVQAATITFTSTLNGANSVPSNASTATGTALMSFDDVTNLFDLSININGITKAPSTTTSTLTNSHIHVGALGLNGGVIFPIGTAPWTDTTGGMSLAITGQSFPVATATANIAALLAGNTYLNIHTTGFPGGEIRGQLTAVPLPAAAWLLGSGLIGLVAASRKKAARS